MPSAPSSTIGYKSAALVAPLAPSVIKFFAVSVEIGFCYSISAAFSYAFGYALGCRRCACFCHKSSSVFVLFYPVVKALLIYS